MAGLLNGWVVLRVILIEFKYTWVIISNIRYFGVLPWFLNSNMSRQKNEKIEEEDSQDPNADDEYACNEDGLLKCTLFENI